MLLKSLLLCGFFLVAFQHQTDKPKPDGGKTMKLTSSAFEDGGKIPAKYTCDGANISPPLTWENPPEGTKTLALISDDPDAPVGIWIHWVIFNLEPKLGGLAEAVPTERTLAHGAKQGINDFRKIGYGGPCPPGGTHRYFFKLYALDTKLELNPGITKSDLLKAMKGHVLEECQLMGTYRRR